MRLGQQVGADLRVAKKIRLSWRALLCIGLGSLPMYWLFDHFGRFDLALPVFNCVAVFAFAVVVKHDLRRQAWFWGVMAILAVLHVFAVLYIPWGDRWVPALAIAAIDSADLVFIFAALDGIARLMGTPEVPLREKARPSTRGSRH